MAAMLTRDWDAASHAVAEAYFPHRLHPAAGTSALGLDVDGVDLGPVRIARIGWGADVVVETEHAGGVAVNLPRDGRLVSRVGRAEVEATPDRATVYPADTPVRITRWTADCAIVGVRYELDRLRREMARILDCPAPLPDALDVTAPGGAAWLALVHSLEGREFGNALVDEQLAGALTAAFVLAACPEDAPPAARPRIVKRVLDRMHADPARAWTAGEMAEAAGVSVRRLQEGFRQYVGTSPHEALVAIRLERVRADLLASVDGDTVASVALHWGFGHTGRFARAYRQRYGEPPSETLRRSLGR